MSDLQHPCERWAERISLAAAGCLSPDEEREVRRHLETCRACRERFRELTQVCGGLADAMAPDDSEEAAIVERVMSAILDVPSAFTHFQTRWRWLMRSPISRVAAAIIFVAATTGVVLWFQGGGATPALADFLEPILEARTVKYKVTTTWTSLPAEMKSLPAEMQEKAKKGITSTVMMRGDRIRTESEGLGGKDGTVHIWDGRLRKGLSLIPDEKRATVSDDANPSKDKKPNRGPQDAAASFRHLLLDAREKPGVKREPLGEKEIDGRRVVGVRIRFPGGVVMSVWGDPETGLPVRIESTVTAMPNMKITQSNFEFNVEMDESLFSLEPPPGYKVGSFFIKTPVIDGSTTEEKDLVEMFREYSRLSGGPFPPTLDIMSIGNIVMLEFSGRLQRPGATEEVATTQQKLQRGLAFCRWLPPEADAHYAGRGVSLGAADRPIFWYRPKDAEAYRVIYADLTIRDADAPPSVIPAPPEQELIDALRCYSELNDGPFPSKLDLASFVAIAGIERQIEMQAPNSGAKPEKPNAEEERAMAEAEATRHRAFVKAETMLRQSLNFVNALPPEAETHYAGRGVSLGQADRPIFWYRPTDSKKYRVLYADLSVREADAPPSVPEPQPEDDLIDMLRRYGEWSGGAFPNTLDKMPMGNVVSAKLLMKFPPEDGQTPSSEHLQEITKFFMKSQAGWDFVGSLPPEADAHYAGRGVSLGAADRPIFWYRPKDAKQYRVLYGDLSVREADMPPDLPDSQPDEDLIDALRCYCRISGGPFPDSLATDNRELAAILEKKTGLKNGQKPNAEQMREITEISLMWQPGQTFVDKLPPEADSHYAGRGVSLGAADTPIFWYRPKDAKTYRVIYADLSVREADAPPDVPDAESLPAPAGGEE